MGLHVFWFLLVFFLLCLALLWRLDWLPDRAFPCTRRGQAHHVPPSLEAPHSRRLPPCRLASPASTAGGPEPAPVRPWGEVISRRGARHPCEYRGLCLSQSAVPVLRDHRCPRPRGFLAMASLVMPSRSRRLAARLATAPSVPGATPRCIA